MNNNLQNFLNLIVEDGQTDITIVNELGIAVASTDADNIDKLLTFPDDGTGNKAEFDFMGEQHTAVFGADVGQNFINLFKLFFTSDIRVADNTDGIISLFYEIINDSVSIADTIRRADALGFDFLTKCIPLLVMTTEDNQQVVEALQDFTDSRDQCKCYTIVVSDKEIVIVYVDNSELDIEEEAAGIFDMVESDCMLRCTVGIGKLSNNIHELMDIYRDLRLAVEVDSAFDAGKHIIRLEDSGVGRLIRELNDDVCRTFVKNVMKDFEELYEKEDYYETINKFFQCNLNSSEAAREMYVHRNTLVYRLNKIKNMTGYDITNFDDAFVFKLAAMLHRYLKMKDAREADAAK